jgi:hypothetical protein
MFADISFSIVEVKLMFTDHVTETEGSELPSVVYKPAKGFGGCD